MLEGVVSDHPARVLFDSGAHKCFVSSAFVTQLGLTILPTCASFRTANNQLVDVSAKVQVPLTLGPYRSRLECYVTGLPSGIDVLLGDHWARAVGLVADYGNNDPSCFVPPHLWLRNENVRIMVSDQMPVSAPAESATSLLLSAPEIRSMLHSEPTLLDSAFMVVVQPSMDTGHDSVSAQLQAVLDQYADVFEEPGIAPFRPGTPLCAQLPPDAKPPNRQAFRLSFKERQEVEMQVRNLLATGRIQPSTSPFGAPVLFVPKPDGTMRMCIDYRELNKLSLRNKYPLPRIDDLLDNLQGSQYFSSLDLASGYWQITLNEEDVQKTAFNTHIGKYEWKVMPFGLTNAPSIFQTLMNDLFRENLNKFMCIYLDDILLFSKTVEEHFAHLTWVLDTLREAGFKACRVKCDFFRKELKFLGHIVSAQGVAPDPAKVQTIVDWPVPENRFDVRRFLGLANYFRRFIQHYARIAAPLTDLLRDITPADNRQSVRYKRGNLSDSVVSQLRESFAPLWTDKCQTAFESLKRALQTAPVMCSPDYSQPFTVVCDACAVSIGGILLQAGHPVAYFSRKLKSAELRYSASDREMLAVVACLREWRCYLEGARFVIETDHKLNTYADVSTAPHTLQRRARWLHETGGYDYEWRYRPGAANVADPVSRAPQHFSVS